MLILVGCTNKPGSPAPVVEAGAAAAEPVPFQATPTPLWNVDFFTVDVGALVSRSRHVEIISVGPVRDEDVLVGLDAGMIPDTTRTSFSDGSNYTVTLHRGAKRAYIATLSLAGERIILQADENLDGLRDSLSETRNDGSEVRWRSSRYDGRFDSLTTQEVVERDGERSVYKVCQWSDADGDGRWKLEKTFRMSNISQ